MLASQPPADSHAGQGFDRPPTTSLANHPAAHPRSLQRAGLGGLLLSVRNREAHTKFEASYRDILRRESRQTFQLTLTTSEQQVSPNPAFGEAGLADLWQTLAISEAGGCVFSSHRTRPTPQRLTERLGQPLQKGNHSRPCGTKLSPLSQFRHQ